MFNNFSRNILNNSTLNPIKMPLNVDRKQAKQEQERIRKDIKERKRLEIVEKERMEKEEQESKKREEEQLIEKEEIELMHREEIARIAIENKERIEQENKERLEAERIQRMENTKIYIEIERREKEKKARIERERKERKEQEKKAKMEREKKERMEQEQKAIIEKGRKKQETKPNIGGMRITNEERIEKERIEKERKEKERKEKERLKREQEEKERKEKERIKREQEQEEKRRESERQQKILAEKKRLKCQQEKNKIESKRREEILVDKEKQCKLNKEKSLQNIKYHYKKRKFSIVMAYYNRKYQTLETLKQFQKMYGNSHDFEVVIVDDNSNDENRLEEDIKQFTFPINLIYITTEEKGERINPGSAYNKGFAEANGDIVIIQNPEIYHCGNLLQYATENIDLIMNNYLTFPVFSSPSFHHNEKLYKPTNNYYKDFVEAINYNDYDFNYDFYIEKYPELSNLNKLQAEKHFLKVGIQSGQICNKYMLHFDKRIINDWKGWYNHCKHNPRNLHFLSMITKDNLNKIGGFCDDFKYGLWYDDDDFLYRIKQITNVVTIDSKTYFGVHQHHTNGSDDHHLLSDYKTGNVK